MSRPVTPITAETLAALEQGFDARPQLSVMSNVLNRVELFDAAFVPSGAARLRMDFSVTVPTSGVTNQKQSGRCWMFSVMNLLRARVCSSLNVKEFSFAGQYLALYDKLEKCNNFFESILDFAGQDLEDRETWELMHSPLPDGGQWDMAVGLIRKYGLVPFWAMPESKAATDTSEYMPILERKLREDGLELRQLVREGKDPAPRRQEMLQEMYNALRILYGQPPKTFDFDYTDESGTFHHDPDLTPLTFFEKYVKDDLDSYTVIIASPIHEVNRTYCQPHRSNLVERNMFWLNLTQEELEALTRKQLEAGEAVCFSCDCHPDRDRAHGWWDQDTFQYGEVLGGLTFGMTKAQRLLTGEATMNHCMMFCGVNIADEDTPDRWKIENSWGDANGQKGYFVCSEKWFEANVFQVVIRRDHLSPAQQALLAQEPIPMKMWDPLA